MDGFGGGDDSDDDDDDGDEDDDEADEEDEAAAPKGKGKRGAKDPPKIPKQRSRKSAFAGQCVGSTSVSQ